MKYLNLDKDSIIKFKIDAKLDSIDNSKTMFLHGETTIHSEEKISDRKLKSVSEIEINPFKKRLDNFRTIHGLPVYMSPSDSLKKVEETDEIEEIISEEDNSYNRSSTIDPFEF